MPLLRLALGIVLVAVLVWTRLLDPRALAPALARPGLLAVALLALFAGLCVAALRWHALLRIQRIHPSLVDTWRVVMAGAFFGTFLPGMLGGDLLRSGYMVTWARHRMSTGMLSILVDRMLGLSGVALGALIVLLVRPQEIPRTTRFSILAALVVLALVAIVMAAIAKRFGRHRPRSNDSSIIKWLRELAHAVSVYRRAPLAVLYGMFLSLIVCAFDVIALLLVTQAMGISALPRVQQAVAGMIALIANAVPFTPGGLGIGEAAFANACIALEPQFSGAPYATAFLVFRCLNILAAIPGSFVGIVPKRAVPSKDPRTVSDS